VEGIVPALAIKVRFGDWSVGMDRKVQAFTSSALLAVVCWTYPACASGQHSYVPTKGFVSSEATAIAIAEAVLFPIYGENNIKKQRPYAAVNRSGVWVVTGSLTKPSAGEVVLGGTFQIHISQRTGEMLKVAHGQ
jgi:hypothetical protein